MNKEMMKRFNNTPHELLMCNVEEIEEHDKKFYNYLTDNGKFNDYIIFL